MQSTDSKQPVNSQAATSQYGRHNGRRLTGSALIFLLAAWATALLVFSPAMQAETFRWVDNQGTVHYTDQLPPEEAKRPRTKLDEAAKVLEVVEGQKSPEQLEQAKRLRQLRADQQRILNEQKDSDASLNRTYRSEEEMQTTLQSKLSTMDSAKKIADSNRLHQVEVLRSLVKRAADHENAGQPIPQSLRDSIESTRRQIILHQEKMRTLDNNKIESAATFKKELEHFKNLQALRNNPEYGAKEWQTQPPQADVNIASAISCAPNICDLAWAFAKDYIKAKSNRPLVIETPTILQTATPREDKDMALLVVRISGKIQDTLFLDTSCYFSSVGEELCISDAVKAIRNGFAPYIEERIKAESH